MSNVYRIELRRARSYHQAGALDLAYEAYKTYFHAEPNDVGVMGECGRMLMDVQRFDEARFWWHKIKTRVEDDAEAFAQLGICCLYTGKAKDSLKYLQRALALQEDNLSIHYAIAGALTHLERDEDALPHLEHITHMAPQDSDGPFVELVCTLSRLKRYEEALEVADEGLEHHDDSAELCFRKALCLGALSRMDDSIVWLRHTIDRNEEHISAWRMMARIDNKAEHVLPRFLCLQRLFRLLPDDGEMALELGMEAYEQEHLEWALAASERAIVQMPEHVFALHLRATILRIAGDLKSACEALRRACQIEPDNEHVLPDFGAALMAIGQVDEAETILLRALQIRPDDEATQKNLAAISVHRSSESHAR